jgi:hypothetical protein
MRRLVILAVIAAAAGWVWKMMTRVDEARVEEEGSPLSQDEDVIDFRARAEAEEETTSPDVQPEIDSAESRLEWSRREELGVGSDWSAPAEPAEEASDEQVRAAIDERLRRLKKDRSQEGRTAA